MAIEVRFRRGTATQHNSFTGANAEITVDTTNKTLRVHDGVTVGGIRLAKYNEIALANGNATFANVTITNLILQNVLGTQYGGTGLTSFTPNGLMFASNTSTLNFVTGTSGGVMQINANGAPAFATLDGGSYA